MIRDLVEEFIQRVAPMKVAVAGETIIDEFIPVSYEGQSMKSICPVYRVEGEIIRQQGGALAIANHIRGFVSSVKLISNTEGEIVKTRYLNINNKEKHVEINRFGSRDYGPVRIDASDYDAVIVADFGHGFCSNLSVKGPFHLMCQTNSNNFGFNRVSKWKALRKKSVCLDLREASLQMNRKIDPDRKEDVMDTFRYEMEASHLILTVGRRGVIYTDGKSIAAFPSFPSEIVDTIGAGDTLYSFSSLAVEKYDVVSQALPVALLAAALSTTWLGNEQSVTREKLLKYADRFV